MADPLTILGSTAASSQLLVQGIKAISFLLDLHTKMKATPAEVQRHTLHIEQLISLSELFKETPSLHISIAPFLETCLSQARKIFHFMQRVAIKDGESWFQKKKKNLRVGLKDKEINQMFVQLEKEKTSLIIAIAQVDSKLLQKIGLDIESTRNGLDEVTIIVKDTAHHTTQVVDTLANMSTLLADIQLYVKSPEIRTVDSQSSTFHLTTHYLIPNRLVGEFFGRKDVLARITEGFSRVRRHGKPNIVTISGLGGQGKTQLALEYCRLAQETGVKAIFWVNAMSKEDVNNSFKEISEIIKDPGKVLQDGEITRFVLQQLNSWPHPWLLVFDNHDDPSAFILQDYFPGGGQGCVLVTSRNAGVDAFSHENAIMLEGLSEPDALDLFFHHSRKHRVEPHAEEHGKSIVERLGNHALAITQAGSYIFLRKLDLAKFMEHYEHQKKSILEHTLSTSEYRRKLSPNEEETALNVFTTWELTFKLLLQNPNCEDEGSEKILTLFAFFDPKDISEELFENFCRENNPSDGSGPPGIGFMAKMLDRKGDWDHNTFEGVVVKLTHMTLVQSFFRDEDGKCHLSLHPLVRDWIRLRTKSNAFKDNSVIAARILVEMLTACRKPSIFRLPLSTRLALFPHIEAYTDNSRVLEGILDMETFRDFRTELNYTENLFCGFLSLSGRSRDAEVIARRAVLWFRNNLGKGHKQTLYASSVLVKILISQGNNTEAELLCRDVLKLRERMIKRGEPEHQETLSDLISVALILQNQGKYKEAEESYRNVLRICERVLGEEHPNTLKSLHNLGLTLHAQGKYKEAREIYRHLLPICERVLGGEHPNTLTSLNNLGLVLQREGKYKEAEETYRKVLQLRESVLGGEHPNTLISLNILGLVLERQGKYKEAEEIHRHVLQLRERVLGGEHPNTLKSLNNLSLALTRRGKYKEAEETYQRVLQIRERVLGLEHPQSLTSACNLAIIFEAQGRHDEALLYLDRSVTGSLKALGADHPKTKARMKRYASLKRDYSQIGKDMKKIESDGELAENDEDGWETEEETESDESHHADENLEFREA